MKRSRRRNRGCEGFLLDGLDTLGPDNEKSQRERGGGSEGRK